MPSQRCIELAHERGESLVSYVKAFAFDKFLTIVSSLNLNPLGTWSAKEFLRHSSLLWKDTNLQLVMVLIYE